MSTILIIEDEKSIVDLISFNLKREGHEILSALDGGTGLELALSGKADLVLLDVMLPVMDGFEVLRRLRQTSDIPVIMVTAREEETDKILGLHRIYRKTSCRCKPRHCFDNNYVLCVVIGKNAFSED